MRGCKIVKKYRGSASIFRLFKLCAGRAAQEINLSKLGSDAGVSHNTARSWLSVMETSYIIHRLPAWHINVRKQVVKVSKLHFFDSGLACSLLGIRELEPFKATWYTPARTRKNAPSESYSPGIRSRSYGRLSKGLKVRVHRRCRRALTFNCL